jgi:cell division protein FtsL
MSRAQVLWMALLLVAIVASGVAVVAAKFQSRSLFVELQKLRAERVQADVEWGRLQLELATQGALGRVMQIAHERLQMRVPEPGQTVVVR